MAIVAVPERTQDFPLLVGGCDDEIFWHSEPVLARSFSFKCAGAVMWRIKKI